ncbi:MAG: hypothetical protein ABI210_11260 [Abditibacteriaceae bacterium]
MKAVNQLQKRASWMSWAGRFGVLTIVLALVGGVANAQGKVWPTELTNIAAAANGGRVIGSTSTLDNDPKFAASNLIDGKVWNPGNPDTSEGWCSNKFDPINMDSVTLGFADNSSHLIGKIIMNPGAAVVPSRWAKDVEVQVSNTAAEGPYQSVAILTLLRTATDQSFTILPVQARFVRLVMRSNWGSDRGTALGEVQIYEAIPQTDAVGQLIARFEQAVQDLKDYRNTQVQMGNGGGERVSAKPAALDQATVQLVQLITPGQEKYFPVSNTNIAAAKNGGKVMNYSSIYDKNLKYGPDDLIDGQIYDAEKNSGSFGWASQGFSPGKEFVTLGFGDDRIHLIGKIVMNPASNQSPLRWARRVDVQVTSGSATDGPWHSAAVINMRTEPVNQEFILRPVEAKYVKLVFMANGPGDINLPGMIPGVNSDRSVSLGEVEIYEATASSQVLDSLIGRFEQILIDLKRVRESGVLKDSTTSAATANKALLHLTPDVNNGVDG